MWLSSSGSRVSVELPAHILNSVSQGKDVKAGRNGNCFSYVEGRDKSDTSETEYTAHREPEVLIYYPSATIDNIENNDMDSIN